MCAIAWVDFRRHVLPAAGIALLVALLAPAVFPMREMTAREAARTVEVFLPLAGAALFSSLFFPERDRGTKEAVASRSMPIAQIWALRATMLTVIAAALSGGLTLWLRWSGSEAGLSHWLAGFSGAMLAGGLAAMGTALSGSMAFGAMAPTMWVALDLCSEIFGRATLFTMMRALPSNKLWLLAAGIALLSGAIGVKGRRNR